jgi:histone-lysine N-methyltransferase SETMAR
MIQSKPLLVMIAWNPRGFHLMNALPNGMTFNSSHCINEILALLLDWYRTQFGGIHRRLIIYANNARPHIARAVSQFCEDNKITKALHPPYSLDLVPSDFCLFWFMKNGLRGTLYEEANDLHGAIMAIMAIGAIGAIGTIGVILGESNVTPWNRFPSLGAEARSLYFVQW